MPNMDYPGPCFSCSAIEGCASERERKEGVKQYCKGVEMELNSWKSRLYDLLVRVDEMKTEDKEQVLDTMNLIKSTVREVENVVERMQSECPSDISRQEQQIGSQFENLRGQYTQALENMSPGWLGG